MKSITWSRSHKVDEFESTITSKCGRFVITRSQMGSRVRVWLSIDGEPVLRYGDCGVDVNFQHITAAKKYASENA